MVVMEHLAALTIALDHQESINLGADEGNS
jgi:hypothetical protein